MIAQAPATSSPARIRDRIADLASIGAQAGGAVTRLAYTRAERDAHERFARWAEEDGARRVDVDAAGNSIAVFGEERPYHLVGSHLDTVVRGGAYDGAAGVIGGLEVARTLAETPAAGCGLRVVAFAGEEGARFGRPNLGAGFAAGRLGEAESLSLVDADGVTLADAAAALGLSPGTSAPWVGEDIACFFELHIEQGRQLEAGAARIGLVDAIAGSVRLRCTFTGRADHSGATPMTLRRDALAGAGELVLAVEAAARAYRSTVATVGRIGVEPNNVTTVAAHVVAWVDVRDVDADRQRRTARTIFDRAGEIAARRGLGVEREVISDQAPVVLVAWARELAHAECVERQLRFRVLPSGAGHDAAVVARRAPATMIFVPCVGGVSHAPEEQADPEDIALASDLVAGAITRYAALSAESGGERGPVA